MDFKTVKEQEARSQQKQVFAAVEQMMTADQHVSSWENTLLMELRMKFRL